MYLLPLSNVGEAELLFMLSLYFITSAYSPLRCISRRGVESIVDH